MGTEFKYWAFISYSHADKKWGDWLHSALETFKVPKVLAGAEPQPGEVLPRKIFPIFRDREELPTSSDLGSMISQALAQSRCLIVICSPRAAQSRWVNQEILDYKRLGRAERILALIVDGEPNAADGKPGFSAEAECFPEAMKYALGADGNLDKNRPTEPIAADARPGMDGRINAKLKLAAGILGINYDDLKRRDERRRRRQQRIVIAVSSALVLTFAALAAAALLQWRMATRETKIANAQTQEAERQKSEADTQRRAAETQKGIADEKTVLAENEKEQVETRTAADEEDLAREALLRGDPLMAAQHLSLVYETEPESPSLRLLLHRALKGLSGLSTVLGGGSAALSDMEVAPHTGFVLTVSNDGEAILWDPQKSVPVATFGKAGSLYNQVHQSSFTPDGKRFLFVNSSQSYLEDMATGSKVPLAQGQDLRLGTLVLSSDGSTVVGVEGKLDGTNYSTEIRSYRASDGHAMSQTVIPGTYFIQGVPGSGARVVLAGGPNGSDPARKVLVVDVVTGKIVAQIPSAWNEIVLVSPQGNLILINHASPAQPPDIYSTQTGAHVAQLSANGVVASHASWSPSGRYLISGIAVSGSTNQVLWDAATWKPLHVWPNVIWTATAIDAAESHLASLTSGGELSVWDLRSGALLKQFDDEICAGNILGAPSTSGSHLQFSPDATRLIDAGGGACATVWNWQQAHSSEQVLSSPGIMLESIAFSPDASRAATGNNDGTATVWSVASGTAAFTLKPKTIAQGAAVPGAFFTPDGKEVITAGNFQAAALWNAASGSPIRQLTFDNHAMVIGDTVKVALLRPGNRAITFSLDGWGALWDLATQKQLASVHTEDGANVRQVSASPDGREFVVADDSGFAFVFNASSGTLKRKLGNAGKPLVAAEISPQDDKLVTADKSGHITLWSLADGHTLQKINNAATAPAVNDIHFSPDGSAIIAACSDGEVRIWYAQTGKLALTAGEEKLSGELASMMPLLAGIGNGTDIQSGMLRVQYSPDGSFFAGANDVAHVMVWDAQTGKQLLHFEGFAGRITALAFTSDGARLGSSSEDGTARIWDLGLESRSPAEIKQEIAKIGQELSR